MEYIHLCAILNHGPNSLQNTVLYMYLVFFTLASIIAIRIAVSLKSTCLWLVWHHLGVSSFAISVMVHLWSLVCLGSKIVEMQKEDPSAKVKCKKARVHFSSYFQRKFHLSFCLSSYFLQGTATCSRREQSYTHLPLINCQSDTQYDLLYRSSPAVWVHQLFHVTEYMVCS